MQKTLAIIKPDAIESKVSGLIINLIELNKFDIIEMQKRTLTKQEGEKFYQVHKEKFFFRELVDHITSGPVILMVLKKENAIKEWRDLMGATDPLKAAPGTIRRMFGQSIGVNAVHGSDSPENAKIEIDLFFGKTN